MVSVYEKKSANYYIVTFLFPEVKDDAMLNELADFGARFEVTPKF